MSSLPVNVEGGTQLPNGDWRLPHADTPGYQANPGAALYYSPTRQLYYTLQGGKQTWISPLAMDPTDRRGLGDGQSLFSERGQFDQNTGNIEHPFNWTNALSLATGAAIAAPLVYGAVAGAGAGGAAGAGAGAGGTLAASTTAPTVGALAAGGTGLAAGAGATGAAAGAGGAIGAGLMGGTSTAATIVGTGAQLFGNLFGAHLQSNANNDAARIAAESARYAADLQAKAQSEALGFTKAQAENAYQNTEASRLGNYGQWAAAQRRIGTLGQMLGLGQREIPAYVAGIDPNFGGASGPVGAGGAQAPAPVVDPSKGDLGAQISAYFKSRGVSDQETPYWVQKWPELQARGQELNDPAYALKRLAAADVFGGGGAAAAQRPPAGSIAALMNTGQTPYLTPSITPALRNPYAPGTVGSYLS